MGDTGSGSRVTAGVVVVLALLGSAPAARATVYGEVEVTVESEPKGSALHGYAEIWVRVANRSTRAPHTVRLTLPKTSYGYGGTDHLRAVTRTVTVEPGKFARVALAYPERLPVIGSGLGVTIDGTEQESPVPVGGGPSGRSGATRTGGFGGGFGAPSGPAQRPLVLYSRDVPTEFPDWVGEAQNRGRLIFIIDEGGGPGGFILPGAPGGPGGPRFPGAPPGLVAPELPEAPPPREPGTPVPPPEPPEPPPAPVPDVPGRRPSASLGLLEVEFVRADQPAASWSPNWLGYTRYDGVVVTADDLRAMPTEVRTALDQYAECGGSLVVLGQGGPLPGRWKPERVETLPVSAAAAGFGECLVTDRKDLSKAEPGTVFVLLDSWVRTFEPWQREHTPADANRAFPVIEDVGVPVKGLIAVMFVFTLVIGPVNLFLLARKKRKLWMFWTVPLVSLVTCLGVFAYMAVNEGWQGRTRVEAFTVLDENTRRASTVGWTAYYTPLLPGGGLHFSPDTEVAFQNGEDPGGSYSYSRHRRAGGSALAIDWTREQHLASGWLTPRVPAHFAVRKSEARRERVTITKGADGRPEAVNGLGADLTELWYADEGGNLFRAGAVPAGGRAALDRADRPPREGRRPTLRDVYAGEWANVVSRAKLEGPALLTPRTYLAFTDAAPFVDDALPGASARRARSVVFGILREGGDE